jgi:hypothetical protein
MKRFSLSLIFCAATTLVAQNYTAYNGLPVSRVSFLRSQYSGHNVFSDSSLLLYLPMTGQQGSALDDSGHGFVATMAGTYIGAFAGKTGPYAPYFKGNSTPNNVMNVSSAVTIPGTFTVSAWVKPNALASNYVRIVESFYQTGFYLGTNSTGTAFEWMVKDPSVVSSATGGTVTVGTWPNTAWQMVTGTYDSSNNGRLYVNGTQVGTTQAFTNPGTTTLNIGIGWCSATSTVGCSPNSPFNAWDGQIQGVRIYGRALSQAEIQAIWMAENH